jgi:hypothetical protein
MRLVNWGKTRLAALAIVKAMNAPITCHLYLPKKRPARHRYFTTPSI